jgi:hypothetical protein
MYDGNFDEKRFDFLIECMWEDYGCGCCGDHQAMQWTLDKLRLEVFSALDLKDIEIKNLKGE